MIQLKVTEITFTGEHIKMLQHCCKFLLSKHPRKKERRLEEMPDFVYTEGVEHLHFEDFLTAICYPVDGIIEE